MRKLSLFRLKSVMSGVPAALVSYFCFVGLASAALVALSGLLVERAAAPVAGLLGWSDVNGPADSQRPLSGKTISRVLESDAWLDGVKAKWSSESRYGPAARTDSRLGRGVSPNSYGGTHRTVCVRLCDGYFFPISFATSEDSFERDQETCARSCSSPARLYVYRNPGQEPEQMIALDGRPYSKLPTAFLFRTRFDQSCKCAPHPWEQEAMSRHRQFAEMAAMKRQLPPGVEPTGRTAKTGKAKRVAAAATLSGEIVVGEAISIHIASRGATAAATAETVPPILTGNQHSDLNKSKPVAAVPRVGAGPTMRPALPSASRRQRVAEPVSRTAAAADWKTKVFTTR